MAFTPEELVRVVQESLPGASVEPTDLTGTRDHWHLLVVWPGFEGLPLFQQHRKVMEVLKPFLEIEGGSGQIHAVQLKTVPRIG